jgi:hypothetical protein
LISFAKRNTVTGSKHNEHESICPIYTIAVRTAIHSKCAEQLIGTITYAAKGRTDWKQGL